MSRRTIPKSVRRRSVLRVWAAAVIVLPLAAATAASAQQPATEGDETAPRFRRLYAPAEGVQRWPFEPGRYLPVAPQEFEQMVQRAEAAATAAESPASAAIAACRFSARFDGDAEFVGTAEMEVRVSEDAVRPITVYPLSPAVENPRWSSGEEALLGTSDSNAAVVATPRSDRLTFAWRARATRDASDGIVLAFDTPVCPATSLELLLPAEFDVQRDEYVVEGPVAVDAETNRWIIRYSGGRSRFRIVRRSDAKAIGLLNGVRQEVSYDFSERGVEVTAQLRIQALHSPLERLELELDAGLTLVDARITDRQIVWSSTPAPAGRNRILLEFDRPLQGTNRTVLLKAVTPLVVGRRHRLPLIRTTGLFWQSASYVLSFAHPLQVARIDPVGCVFTPPTPLAGNRSGEAVELHCYAPDGTAELLLTQLKSSVEASSLTLVTIAEEETHAEYRAGLRVDFGEVFDVDAAVPAGWIVDSIQTTPTNALRDWTLSDVGEKRRKLSLRLLQPLTPDRPLRLSIVGRHKRHAVGESWRPDDFRFIEIDVAHDDSPLIALTTEPRLALEELHADARFRPEPDALDPLRRELLGGARPTAMFDAANVGEQWRARVTRRRSELAASIDVVADFAAGGSAERYRFRLVRGDDQPLDHVMIRFFPAKSSAFQWSLPGEVPGLISVSRHRDADVGVDSETWQVRFEDPIGESIEVEAVRLLEPGEIGPVSLASVLDVREQSGRVFIASDSAISFDVGRLLKALPAQAAPAELSPRLRGAFAFDPGNLAADAAPMLRISTAAGERAAPRAVVWNMSVETQVVEGRPQVFQATLLLQGLDAGWCRLTCPAGAAASSLTIDGKPFPMDRTAASEVSIPVDIGLSSVVVRYESSNVETFPVRRLELSTPTMDVPVLNVQRSAIVPVHYDVTGNSGPTPLDRDLLRRLFGPLASPAARGFAGEAARRLRLADSGRAGGPAVVEDKTAEIFSHFGAAARTAHDWRSLLQDFHRRLDSHLNLRIDADELRYVGLAPRSPVVLPAGTFSTDAELGDSLLQAAGLAIFSDGQAVILTSPYSDGEVDDDFLRVFQSATVTRWRSAAPVSLESWLTLPNFGVGGGLRGSIEGDGPNGLHRRVAVQPDGGVPWIVRYELPPAPALAVVLAAFFIGRGYLAQRRGRLLFALLATTVAAITLPDWAAAVATSALLGIAAGVLIRVMLPPIRRSWGGRLGVTSLSGERKATGSAAKFAAPVLWVGILLPADAAAQSAPMQGPPAQVFIPVDADGKPDGGRYLVPEKFLAELKHFVDQSARDDATDVLWQRVRYAASITRDAEPSRFIAAEVRAIFTFHVLRAPAEIELPLSLVGDTGDVAGLLNDRLIEVRRNAGGKSLLFEASKVGANRLELVFNASDSADADAGLTLLTPRMNDAALELSFSEPAANVEVSSAAEALRWTADGRTASARLMPADKVAIGWSKASQVDQSRAAMDRLTWLKIRPGSVVADLKLRIRPPSGGMSELLLLGDPRLQWLPKQADNALIADVEQTPITADQATVGQRIAVKFSRPVVEEEVVEVSFLVTGSSGIGNLRLPELRPADDLEGRRLLAVGVDPSLESTTIDDPGAAPLAVPEFMKAWGNDSVLPQAAFELQPGQVNWAVSVRPRPVEFQIRQQQTLVCGRRRMDVALEAELETRQGTAYQVEIAAPQELEVDSVTSFESGTETDDQVLRWSRDERGSVVVFFRSPLNDMHRLTIRGRIQTPPTGNVPLPTLNAAPSSPGERSIRIARYPDTLVSVGELKQMVELPLEGFESLGVESRLAAILRVDGATPGATLRLEENPRRFSALLRSGYLPEGPIWNYEAEAAIDVGAGVLDVVELELPAQITTPLSISPSMPYEVVPGKRDGERLLIVRPRQAIRDRFHFSVRAVLSDVARDRPLPYVRLRRIDTIEQYFQLPRHAGALPVRWERTQLNSANLPTDFKSVHRDEFDTYRAVGSTPKIVLRAVRAGGGNPTIRLAEHRVVRRGDAYTGLSTFIVDPAGVDRGALRLPAGASLLAMQSGGHEILPSVDSEGALLVGMSSTEASHMVEVLYRGDVSGNSASEHWVAHAPRWDAFQVERTIWMFSDADENASWSVVAGVAASQARCLQEQLSVLAGVRAELADDPSAAADGWLSALEARYRSARAELMRFADRSSDGQERNVVRDFLVAYDADAAASGDAAARPDALTEIWQSSYGDLPVAIGMVGNGELPRVELRRTGRDRALLWRYLIAPAACAATALAIWWFLRIDGLARWPHLVGTAVGVLWIVCLRPEFIGWFILVAVLTAPFHPSLRRAGSRTLQLGRSASGVRGP